MARPGLTFEWRGDWSLEQRTDIRRVGFQARNLKTGEVHQFAKIGPLRAWVTRRVKRELVEQLREGQARGAVGPGLGPAPRPRRSPAG